jgi:spermidine synthase
MYKNKYNKYILKYGSYVIQTGGKFRFSTESGITKFWFDGDEESYQSMYNVNDPSKFYLSYIPLLVSFLDDITKINNCLMIGLGGGQIPMYVNKKFPNAIINVVEIDPNVIEVSKLSGFNHTDKLTIHLEDGNLFINKSTSLYDAIIMDLDEAKSYESFNFSNIKKILSIYGVLAVNAYNKSKTTESSLLNKINHNFKNVILYSLEHNDVFICRN